MASAARSRAPHDGTGPCSRLPAWLPAGALRGKAPVFPAGEPPQETGAVGSLLYFFIFLFVPTQGSPFGCHHFAEWSFSGADTVLMAHVVPVGLRHFSVPEFKCGRQRVCGESSYESRCPAV